MGRSKQKAFPMKYGSPKEEAWSYICTELGWNQEQIELNKSSVEKFLKCLLPGKNIQFIDKQIFTIDTETGTILEDDSDLTTKKVLAVGTRVVPTMDYFNDEQFSHKYMYIYDIIKRGDGIEMRVAEYSREKKKPVTFTINEDLYASFSRLADKMAVNKSKFVENKIKEFIEKFE